MIKITVDVEGKLDIDQTVLSKVTHSIKFFLTKHFEEKEMPNIEIDVNIDIKEATNGRRKTGA